MITTRGSSLQAGALLGAMLAAGLGLAGREAAAQPRGQAGQAVRGSVVEQMAASARSTAASAVERILRMSEELGLSAEQTERLNAMRVEAVERRAARAAEWMKLTSETRAGLRERSELREVVRERAEEAASLRREQRQQLEAVLTDEQQQRLRRMRVRAALRMREGARETWRGWRGGRDGRGWGHGRRPGQRDGRRGR